MNTGRPHYLDRPDGFDFSVRKRSRIDRAAEFLACIARVPCPLTVLFGPQLGEDAASPRVRADLRRVDERVVDRKPNALKSDSYGVANLPAKQGDER